MFFETAEVLLFILSAEKSGSFLLFFQNLLITIHIPVKWISVTQRNLLIP